MAGSGRKSAVRGAFLLLVASCAAAPGRLAAQALVGGEAAAVGLPGRVAVERIEGGPTVVVYAEAAEPLVAVRVSFALDPAGGHAEALADILQRLARRGMEAQAALAGGRVKLSRTPGHAVFTVTGPAVELPALVDVIRRGAGWRGPREAEVEAARLTAATAARASDETPEAALRRRLAASLFPLRPAAPGAVPSREQVTPETLRSFWARSFRPERMQVVVVGGVAEAEAVAAFRGWPAPREDGGVVASSPGSDGDGARAPRTGPSAQVVFPWAAAGYPSEAPAAVLAVTARLLEQRLAALPLRAARAEVWWQGGDRAIVLEGSAAAPPGPVRAAPPQPARRAPASEAGRRRGAARPAAPARAPASARVAAPARPQPAGDSAAAPASLLASAPGEVAKLLTAARVAEARDAVVRDILLSGRTVEGLAGYLGELFERTGDPAGGEAFLRQLAAVDAEAVGQVLDAMRSGTPVVAEIRP